MAEELSRYLRGWLGYFGKCETPSVLAEVLSSGSDADSGLRYGNSGSGARRGSPRDYADGL